jgi:hypothetical protein
MMVIASVANGFGQEFALSLLVTRDSLSVVSDLSSATVPCVAGVAQFRDALLSDQRT